MATKKTAAKPASKKSNEPIIFETAQIVALRPERGENQSVFWGRLHLTQSAGSRYESGREMDMQARIVATLTYGPADNAEALLESMRASAEV